MKRRILSLALTFVMAFALLTGMSTASDPKPIYDEIIGSGKCGDDLTWKLTEDGTLTISGTGKMTSAPWDAYRDKIKTLIIEDSVTNICNSAFNACRYLTTVTIPSSVVNVGIGAFSHCQGLTEIKVASGNAAYKDINGVLYDIEAKTLIEYPAGRKGEADLIPDTVTSIGERAFGGCVYLTDVTIPDSVTNIGTYAFVDCHSLVNTVIPDSVVTIGTCAFQRNDSLASITIPASVASIGEGVFGLCCSLTEIRVDPDNAAYCDIDGVLFSKDKTLLLAYPVGRGDASYTVPDGVTRIGTYVFSVTDMDMEKCVRSITIPDSVSQIDTGAFYNCDLLTDVYYGGAPIQWKRISIGGNNDPLKNAEIHYAKTDDEIPVTITASGECGKNLTWELSSDGVLTISGYGEMTNWESFEAVPWYAYRDQIQKVVIKGAAVQAEPANLQARPMARGAILMSVPDADGVTSIGSYAFYGCANLKSVIIPDSVTNIGYNAFAQCKALEDVYYAGTQEQWMQIEAVDGSDMISAEVQIHYESTGGNTPGDADGNGAVNTTDVILVRRYIAGGYNVKIDENAADVDGNGVINTTDVILMRRFIAGGYGVVLKPGKIA